MIGKIIMCTVCFGCGILFFAIGSYAKRLEKPMWFWSGIEVDPSKIADVKSYNKANGIMWQIYSLFFWISGILELFYPIVALIFLIFGSTVGIVFLVYAYNQIYKKYQVK